MFLSVALLAVGLFTIANAQSCSVATTSPLNGLCPTGYTLVSSACCPTASVIGTGVTTTAPCADLKNPRTGVNECPGMYAYCRNSAYLTLMREQCPKTCGYCS
ncbi:shTK domain protein [Teladorsagia circumcincta]|uniref:ShTK domain protein n=1 Tax=Teladorsagia circumcincta TaxID=45464 RepID=A0A2G9UTU6_TELCI|nr:shTK domain protein [Teladorsagia circumcincta]